MKFKLTEKTYKNEKYEATPFQWRGKKIKPIVRMWYHTRLKWWDVSYDFRYGKGFLWSTTIKSKGMIDKRKEARKFANEYMKKASKDDINKLSDFYRSSILEKK